MSLILGRTKHPPRSLCSRDPDRCSPLWRERAYRLALELQAPLSPHAFMRWAMGLGLTDSQVRNTLAYGEGEPFVWDRERGEWTTTLLLAQSA